MAISPSIPTSFVPKQPVGPTRKQSVANNILMIVAVVLLVVTLAAAGGMFVYSKYLQGLEQSKAQQLLQKQKEISSDSVEQFIRLKNRLLASETLVNQHVQLSQFFDELEKITLQNVRFVSMNIQVAADRTATLNLTGQAKTFNTLAAQSKAFASEPYIKSAIFSSIAPDSSSKMVNFSISATIDPRLVLESEAPGTVPDMGTAATSSVPTSALPSVTQTQTTTTKSGTSTGL